MKKTLLFTIGILITVLFGATAQQRATNHNYRLADGPRTNQSNTVPHGIISAPPANMPEYSVAGGCPDTLLYEDFQSQTIPAGWLNLDFDGNTDFNGRPNEWYTTFDGFTTLPGDTNWVAASSSWFATPGASNNVLITAAVSICDPTTILNWKSAPFEGPTYMDGYRISVFDGVNTTVLGTFAEGDSIGNVGAGIMHPNFDGNNGLLTEWTASLAPWMGMSVEIVFEHITWDDNLIMIDDIFIGTPPNGDVAVGTPYRGTDYTFVPISQNQPITPEALMANLGADAATNPTMDFNAWLTGFSVYNSSETQASLAGNATSVFTAGASGTLGLGNHLISATASADETDPDLSNNSDTTFLNITDTIYGRDDNIINGVIGIGEGNSGFLGNSYEIFAATSASSISAYLDNPDLGDTVYFSIYNTLGGVPSAQIGTTVPYIIGSADTAGVFLTLPMVGGPMPLAAGTYVVGVEESVSGNSTVAYSTDNYQAGTTWVFFGGAWSNSEDFAVFPAYIVRLNVCDAPEVSWSSTSSGLTANFIDATIGNDLSFWLWDFGDGNTSTMQDPSHTYAAPGNYTVCLTVTGACGTDSACGSVTVMNIVTPPNDSCIDAITINCGDVITATNVGASDDLGPDFCAQAGGSGAGVWYTTVGNGTLTTLSTCSPNTDFDTEITVMSGDCNNLVCVGSNDDDFACPNNTLQSTFSFNSEVGVTYYIYVGTYWGGSTDEGVFELSMTCTAPPLGDDVCNPIALSMGVNGPYDNTAATVQTNEPYAGIGTGLNACQSQDGWCSFENGLDNTMWFTFEAPASGNMIIHTDGSDHDTQIAVWSADTCQDLLGGGETLIAANDDNPAFILTEYSSILILCGLTPGETYFLQTDGYNGDAGTSQLITLEENPLMAGFTNTTSGLSADFTSTAVGGIATYEWDFGDGNVSFDVNPSHTYSSNGTYTVCLTVTDSLGCMATHCETVTVSDVTISVAEAVDRGLTIYPNPSDGRFTVNFVGAEAEVVIEVTDIAGRLLYSEAETLTSGTNKEIDLDAAKGTYLLQVKTVEGVVSRRIQIH